VFFFLSKKLGQERNENSHLSSPSEIQEYEEIMFCPACAKLAYLNTKRICVRCQGVILNNISCICDTCSNDNKICSACLKKITVNPASPTAHLLKGCGCGKKK